MSLHKEDMQFIWTLLGCLGTLIGLAAIWIALTWTPQIYPMTLKSIDERVDGVVVTTIRP